MVACAACGEENAERARFCSQCGGPIAVAIVPVREERKVVTVLFCDLVGFTSRSEGMDVEDVRGTLQPYHALLREELERFGGTVEKFIGDAVMALFGAPVAREDDAERAVRAAMAIQSAVQRLRERDARLDLHVRVGVNTGEALVAVGARPSEGEGMAFGDVVNVAARLQSAAPVDGVIVGEGTYRATQRIVQYAAQEPISAKGKSHPLSVWSVVRIDDDAVLDAGDLDSVMIGRREELHRLRVELEDACSGNARLVTIVGAAGVGKSRLVSELRAASSDSCAGAMWHRGRAASASSPFAPFAEIVRSLVGVLASDPAVETRRKLRAVTNEVLSDARVRAWVEGHLYPLLGLEGETPGDRRVEAFAAWRRLLQAVATRTPLVLVFEDLHWADDATMDLIGDLSMRLGRVRVLLVCTGRPEGWERRPRRDGLPPGITLWPLAAEEAERLLRASLTHLEEPLGSMVVERCGGNPLFIREYARMLEEHSGRPAALSGTGQAIPLPETVQAVIAARLDTLDGDDKAIAQEAAVIGGSIWPGAVAHAGSRPRAKVERCLDHLVRRGFMHMCERSSITGEHEYTFDHVLIRDVAYSQMVRRRRATLHERAGDWAAEVGSDRDELIDAIAHHYTSALALLRAIGQDGDALTAKARRAVQAAGDHAMALNAFTRAEQHYAEALDVCHGASPRQEPSLLLALGRARYYGTDADPGTLAEARDQLLALGDRNGAAEAEMLIGFWLGNHGRMEEGLPHSEHARRLLADAPASRLKGEVVVSLGERAVLAGDVERGVALCREAIAIASATGLDELRAQALLASVVAQLMQGNLEAEQEIEEALEAVRESHSPRAALISMNAADVLRWLGRLPRSFQVQANARERADELGTPFLARLVSAELARRAWYEGDWDVALTHADRLLAEIDAGRPLNLESSVRIIRASIRSARGDHAAASDDLDRAVEGARASGDPEWLLPALAARARLLSELAAHNRATHVLDEVETMLPTGPRFLWGPALADAAVTALAGGQEAPLRAALTDSPGTTWREAAIAMLDHSFARAARLYHEIGSAPDEAQARLLAGRALLEQGNHAAGRADLQRSLKFWRNQGATPYVRNIEAQLAGGSPK